MSASRPYEKSPKLTVDGLFLISKQYPGVSETLSRWPDVASEQDSGEFVRPDLALRCLAMDLLSSGVTQATAASALGISRALVGRWHARYLAAGRSYHALMRTTRGRSGIYRDAPAQARAAKKTALEAATARRREALDRYYAGERKSHICEAIGMSRSTLDGLIKRFEAVGPEALDDRRGTHAHARKANR